MNSAAIGRNVFWLCRYGAKIVVLFLCCFSVQADAGSHMKSHVLIISIDGLRPSIYTESQRSKMALKNLRALKHRGIYADQVITVFPSVTFPAHTTIVTGTNPDHHGVTSNFYPGTLRWMSEASDIHGTTLWQAAKSAGLTTAAVMWPMTHGADMNWVIVESSELAAQSLGPRAALQQGSTKGLFDQMEREVGKLATATTSDHDSVARIDRMSAAYGAQILKDHRPDLMLVHFLEADHMQHLFGPDSDQAARAFEHIDAHIGTLLAALKSAGMEQKTDVIVLGDHGFTAVHTAINVDRLLLDLGFARTDNGKVHSDLVRFDSQAGSGAFFAKPGATPEALAKFTAKLEALVDTRYRTLLTFLSQRQLKELGGYPGAVAALGAAPGYMLVAVPSTQRMFATHVYKGMHGYLPDIPQMATGLIAAGPDINGQNRRFPVLRLLDVAPTVAAILGISLPDAEGSIIAGALNTPPEPDNHY